MDIPFVNVVNNHVRVACNPARRQTCLLDKCCVGVILYLHVSENVAQKGDWMRILRRQHTNTGPQTNGRRYHAEETGLNWLKCPFQIVAVDKTIECLSWIYWNGTISGWVLIANTCENCVQVRTCFLWFGTVSKQFLFTSKCKITILNLIFEMNAKEEIFGAELKIWRHFDQCLFATYCCPANCTLQVGVFGSDSGPEMLRGWPEVQRVLVNRIQLHQTEQVHNSLSVDCIEYTILQVFWCPFVGAGLGQDWKRTCAQNISESRTNWFSWFFGILCFTDCVFGNCIDRSMAINNLISIVCWMS